jgi:N-ethylmaleimide reductase
MQDSDPVGLTTWVARELNRFGLAYLHMMRADFFQQQQADVLTPARKEFKGVLVANMGYSADEAAAAITQKSIDAVAFGTTFLANPDLPARFRAGASLNAPDPATFYTQSAEGYIDYPMMDSAA